MKRFILILAVMMFTTLSANAMYMQGVGGVGHPTHVMMPSGHMRSINNFGSNAAFLPKNTVGAAARMRMARGPATLRGGDRFARPYGYNGYNMGGSMNTPRPVQVSRFDRNYQISTTRKSYTRNGVTYFE